MKTKKAAPNSNHLFLRAELLDVMKKHEKMHNMRPEEILAVLSHMVGQVLAMQDQTKITPAMGLKLIGDNIEQGNQEAIDNLMKSEGSA